MAIVLTTFAVLSAPTAAHADPVVPQPGSPCTPNFANAMTWLPERNVNVVCLQQADQGYEWEVVTADYPSSDRWLSYGPPLTLHGEGTRNYNLRSGEWIAVPQDSGTQCIAEQIVVVSASVVSSPQVEAGATGEQLSFRVLPNLFSISMKGDSMWTKVNS